MRHIWSVLCGKYIIDKDSNNLSLIDIQERISFKGELPDKRPLELPLPSAIYFVSNWSRGSESDRKKHEALIKVISPDGQHIGCFSTLIDLEQSQGQRSLGKIDRLIYTVNGVYEFQVCIKEDGEWKPVASIPLNIMHEEPSDKQKGGILIDPPLVD